MAQVIVTESYLENIGDAIRSKLGGTDTYTPAEMAGAISQIHGDPVLEALSVTQNGTYNPSSGKDGFSQAVVNVSNSYAVGDEGKVVNNGALVAQTSQSITENGTYDTTLKNEVVVDVAGGGGSNEFITTFALIGSVVRGNGGQGSASGNVSFLGVRRFLFCLHIWCPDVSVAGTVSLTINGTNYPLTSYTSKTYTDEYHAVRCYELELPNAIDITSLGYSFSGLAYNSASEFHGEIYVLQFDEYPEDTEYREAIYNLAMTSNDYTDSKGYEFIVSASSVYENTAQPYKAFDGQVSSGVFDCWHPVSGTPQWIQMQFPYPIIIKKFTIYNRPSYVEHPTEFTVQGSNDGSTWDDLTQVSWSATGSGLHLDVEVPASQSGYSYYRLYITGVTSSPYGVISDIQFTEVVNPN